MINKTMTYFFLILFSIHFGWAKELPLLKASTVENGKVFSWNWREAEKGTVVIFLSATCPCSNGHVSYLKNLKELWPQFKFISIHSNPDENQKTTKKYFKEVGPNFEVLQDEETKLANMFGAYRTPHAYVISKNGEILYQGGVTNSSHPSKADIHYLSDALTSVHKGERIKVDKSRVLGCEIERD